jgi:hypothetical protein
LPARVGRRSITGHPDRTSLTSDWFHSDSMGG